VIAAEYLVTVPNGAEGPEVVRAFVARAATVFPLEAGVAERLANAAARLVSYAVQYGYPENRRDQITASLRADGGELHVRIRDHGVPLIPGESDQPEQRAEEQAMVAALAEFRPEWNRLGYEGKEAVLSARLLGEPASDPRAAFAPERGGAEPAPAEAYAIRPLESRDAAAVSRLVFRTYGYTYDDEDYYYPERIVAENATGAMISVVAVHPSGEVVGHYALERREPTTLYEGSSAVVDPTNRGRKLMERMRQFAMQEGARRGLFGVYFLPWTIHTMSQQANEHFGARLCAINLSDTSPVALKGYEADSLAQRVSTVLYFAPLQTLEPATVYAPERHRPMIERLYASLGREVTFGEGASSEGETHREARTLPHDLFGEIVVSQLGADAVALITHELRDLTVHHPIETVYLDLPLAQPGTPAVAEAMRVHGFSFLGIGPGFLPDGDALRLALITQPLDPDHIHVLSPLGQDLLAYALADAAELQL